MFVVTPKVAENLTDDRIVLVSVDYLSVADRNKSALPGRRSKVLCGKTRREPRKMTRTRQPASSDFAPVGCSNHTHNTQGLLII